MAVRLFVGNLPYSATEADIRQHFSVAGPVASVWLPMDRETGRPRGFAFVEFADRGHAEDAIRRFNNQPLGGRNITVNEARPQERSSSPPPRRESPAGGYSGGGGPGRGYGGGAPSGGNSGARFGGPGAPRVPSTDDLLPPPDAEQARGERRRSFGPDAQPKRSRKGGLGRKCGGDRERVPKGPLAVRSGGRFFGDEDDYEDVDTELDDSESDVDEAEEESDDDERGR